MGSSRDRICYFHFCHAKSFFSSLSPLLLSLNVFLFHVSGQELKPQKCHFTEISFLSSAGELFFPGSAEPGHGEPNRPEIRLIFGDQISNLSYSSCSPSRFPAWMKYIFTFTPGYVITYVVIRTILYKCQS